jgi:hypothetical protein
MEVDIYGNPSPGQPRIDFGFDSSGKLVDFLSANPQQQAERKHWFDQQRQVSNLEGRDIFIGQGGGPGPISQESNDLVRISRIIGEIVSKQVASQIPGGQLLGPLGDFVVGRQGNPFRGAYSSSPIPDVAGQGAAGIGGGLLLSVLGSYAGQAIRKQSPKTRALITGGVGTFGKLLAGQNALTVT